MKIVCSGCKMVLGEQRPFSDPSEIEAKCTSCLAKEKEAAQKVRRVADPEKEREVVFENGWGIEHYFGKEKGQTQVTETKFLFLKSLWEKQF